MSKFDNNNKKKLTENNPILMTEINHESKPTQIFYRVGSIETISKNDGLFIFLQIPLFITARQTSNSAEFLLLCI